MGNITIQQVCDAVEGTIHTTLTNANHTLKQSQSMDELSEDYPEMPMMQVYWQGHDVDPLGTDSNRTTFQGGVIVTAMTIYVDLIVRQRSQLKEDYSALAIWAEALDAAVAANSRLQPLFGLAGLKGLAYRCEPVTFQRGGSGETGQPVQYVGVRAILALRIF